MRAGFVCRTDCHDGRCLWRIPRHRFCDGKLGKGVPPPLRLGLRRRSCRRRRRVDLILIGAGISATLSGSGRWLVPPRPSLRFWLCVGLVLTVAARSWGASGLGAGATRRRAGAWQRTQRPRVPPLKRRRASRPGTARRAGAPPPLPPPPPSRSIPPAAAPRSAAAGVARQARFTQ